MSDWSRGDPICHQVLAALQEDFMNSESTASKTSCGDGVLTSLQQAADISPSSITIARTLHRLADENINTVPYSTVASKWLQLYTDTAILETLANILTAGSSLEDIRRLDMAIIVTGGLDRLALIHTLLRHLQQQLPSVGHEVRPRKRARLEPDITPIYAPRPIKEIAAPSLETFLAQTSLAPFIVRKYVEDGTACPRWRALDRWASGQYLLDIAGPGRVVPVEMGRAYDEEDWTQKIIPFDDFLGQAGFLEGTPEAVYLAQYSLFHQLPELEKDIAIPDYAWSQPDSSYPGYRSQEPQLNVWVGSGSSRIVSPPHTDPFFNVYVQVVGHKRVWLAPPQVGPQMEAYSVDCEEGSVIAKEYMGNTSRVPILKADSRGIWEAHPEFKNMVYPHSQENTLGPGDMLFLPPGWWHAMRGEGGPVWSVSIWF